MLRADHIPEPPLEPPEERHPRCPCCFLECDKYYKDWSGRILGCDLCIDEVDAWDELEQE